jgi:putative transposase
MPLRRIRGIEGKPSVYHCMSRTVSGAHLFDDVAKEMLRKHLWQAADFSGVQILTYAILNNHFHVLVAEPDRAHVTVSDAELIRRYRRLYPKPTQFRPAQICVLEKTLAAGGPDADRLRRCLLARMHDVSQFMKTVKQRFSVWFNRTHERYGTLWADRFRSTLIEAGRGNALLTVAAYLDLNPVRAGLTADPKDYRFCGYAEAIAGSEQARCGISAVIGEFGQLQTRNVTNSWKSVAAAYRQTLVGQGSAPRENTGQLAPAAAAQVRRRRGHLPLAQVLRCRLRAFTDGAVLGSRAFVLTHLAAYRIRSGRRRTLAPQPLRLVSADGPELFALRGCPSSW